ncbi:hypothetical protein [Sphingopyxis terrae]|uniref:hypothetical protein n=1 Tax=Sphingopyxis terrae TaxID=33052 RepID=UPI0007888A33|nr:hypothetical protein [Sphingopyxis terrae]
MRLAKRFDIAARTLGATVGAYALAALVAYALARLWPGSDAEAVVTGTIVGVLAMPAAAIWMFGASSIRRAWGGLALAGGVATIITWAAGLPT